MSIFKKIVRGVYVMFLFIFLGGPLYWLINTSFKTPIDLLAGHTVIFPSEPYIANYREALSKSGIVQAFLNSISAAFFSTCLILILVLVPAHYFARKKNFISKSMSVWILISQVFPLSLIVIPLFLILQRLQLVNSRAGLILVYLVINLPFSLWLLRNFVIAIPIEIEEASMLDGVTKIQFFRFLLIPLLLPGLIVVAIFTFINVWNEFFFALVLISDPEKSTLPLKLAQFLGSEGRGRIGALAAATVISTLPSLLLFGVIQKRFSENLVAGALKG